MYTNLDDVSCNSLVYFCNIDDDDNDDVDASKCVCASDNVLYKINRRLHAYLHAIYSGN